MLYINDIRSQLLVVQHHFINECKWFGAYKFLMNLYHWVDFAFHVGDIVFPIILFTPFEHCTIYLHLKREAHKDSFYFLLLP